jgi:hypothetical protein
MNANRNYLFKTYNPLAGLNARQIQRIFRIRANRKYLCRRYKAIPSPEEQQAILKEIKEAGRTEGEVEVPAVCYECGVEGKCLVVESEDEDWLCLDCSCW